MKKENWEVVCSELRKFGIVVTKDKKEKLVLGVHSTIHQLLK